MWHDHDIDFARWLHPALWHVALDSWQWIHQVAAPCNVIRGSGMTCHWIRPVAAPCNVTHSSGIMTLNSPGGSTLQYGRWLWDDMPLLEIRQENAHCCRHETFWINGQYVWFCTWSRAVKRWAKLSNIELMDRKWIKIIISITSTARCAWGEVCCVWRQLFTLCHIVAATADVGLIVGLCIFFLVILPLLVLGIICGYRRRDTLLAYWRSTVSQIQDASKRFAASIRASYCLCVWSK